MALNFKNCRIIVKDMENDNVLSDTRILSHDNSANTIKVSVGDIQFVPMQEICMLIFEQKRLYEYQGTLGRTMTANEITIFLKQGQERESRGCKRYTFEMPGEITALKIENTYVKLHTPIPLKTRNISANGLLLKTMATSLYVGMIARLELQMDGKIYQVETEVMRTQNASLQTEEYGCQNIYFAQKMES